ncbi:MAG: NAD-dependent epimerase/dehydratase family protein [Desulfobacteraceae bacterium]|nr:NAD-dependent epimerase/dehydratase family protein [Desulfobacteraceae bacterium]
MDEGSRRNKRKMNQYRKKVLITGVSGFIGRALCEKFLKIYSIIGIDNNITDEIQNVTLDFSDITDYENTSKFINIQKPDIIVHCAGIAHQKIGSIDFDQYFSVNSNATESLAKAAIKANPDAHFIFLSSISVYGEDNIKGSVPEDNVCIPSSDYALSKLDAEKRLVKLYDSGLLKKIDILRLAPVYDSEWSLNLDRRVFAPKKIAYLKFGSGEQKMSAVFRQNLVDFIEYRLDQEKDKATDSAFCNIFNVCDKEPYKFKEIITVFKESDYQPNRMVLNVSLAFVWTATRLAGLVFRNKRQWLHSCYDKLACSLVFDNKRMLGTGFKHRYSLKSVFLGK